MKVGILAVQGAFAEHEQMLNKLGIDFIELRQKSDTLKAYDALILPGGESTVQGKLIKDLDMFDNLKAQISNGIPVIGTCAGMILLANKLSNDERTHLQTMPITVKRNSYGRQLGSFHVEHEYGTLGKIPMTFIRAPHIESCAPEVEILATIDNRIVAAKYNNQLALSFHPELDNDTRIFEDFIKLI
jgi:5'-phosphate synthase pdxT subunit